MKKIIVQEMITTDGFFAGPNGEIDWHNVDAEFNKHSLEFLNTVDTFMFGHITYDLMAGYWPTPDGLKDDGLIADKMNSLQKIIFSKTLMDPIWNNSKVLHEINKDEIMEIKRGTGKDIAIFGSGTIVSQFTELNLIDEYRFIVNPIVLGKGKTLFGNLDKHLKLKLLNTEEFKSGNVSLSYKLL